MIWPVLAILGWTILLTEGAGPFGFLSRLRNAWPAGPLSCTLCTGAWVGVGYGLGKVAGDRWPVILPGLAVLGWLGAGGAIGWTSSRVLLYVQRATERAEQQAWLARLEAEHVQEIKDPPQPPQSKG